MTTMITLNNNQLKTKRIEALIFFGYALGASLLAAHKTYGKQAEEMGGRIAKVFVEFQRKSFHMIGGCLICSWYHWGIKWGAMAPAFQPIGEAAAAAAAGGKSPMDAGICFLGGCLVTWMIEAARLQCPPVQRWYLGKFKGLVREKELTKAAGTAYFIPGALAAMMAAPSNYAVLGVLFLSIGDAAASIGTAAGRIPVGSSSRKVEGSIGCFAVCTMLGRFAGLRGNIAARTSLLVAIGEVLAEVIGLDDNFVIPMLTVLGARLAMNQQLGKLLAVMGGSLGAGVLLGAAVGSSTPKKLENREAAK
mmetsp:Transcript_41465/g.119534  ORF Transcript_41465/g.119534 Transcript_41465/m.119534 type:complete len:306 (-) Transcript_41465:171-1088(-)